MVRLIDFLVFSPLRYTPLLDGVAQTFIDQLVRPRLDPVSHETPEDFLADLYKWALESVTLLALNTNLGCLAKDLAPDSEQMTIIRAVQGIFSGTQKLDAGLLLWKLMPMLSSNFREFSKDYDTFSNLAKKHIHQSLLRSREGGEPDEDPPLL